jgi:drug/metabolite transporter (DMT)-like permease
MASFSLLAPVAGVLFGAVIFDEQITGVFLIALVMVGSGILLVNRKT